MDISKCCSLLVKHIEENKYYTEMSLDSLKSTIYTYLATMYQNELLKISSRMDSDREAGEPWTNDKYEKELDRVKHYMFSKTKELMHVKPDTIAIDYKAFQ